MSQTDKDTSETFQRDGLETVLGELEIVLSVTALMICAFFKFNDLSAEIISLTESVIAALKHNKLDASGEHSSGLGDC